MLQMLTVLLLADVIFIPSCCQTGVATVADGIPDGWMGLDVGEESIAQFCAAIEKAQTIVWNGPVGVFEFDNFAKGSRAVLDSIVMATERGATSIIGMSMGVAEQYVQSSGSSTLEPGQLLCRGICPVGLLGL